MYSAVTYYIVFLFNLSLSFHSFDSANIWYDVHNCGAAAATAAVVVVTTAAINFCCCAFVYL